MLDCGGSMIKRDVLVRSAAQVLSEYMGIAGEFAAEDAMEPVIAAAGTPVSDDIQLMIFFVALGKLLPPNVSYEKVKSEILSKYKGAV
jgi:hypothetical protein